MANLGIAPHIIEVILNHISGAKSGMAGLYNRSKYSEGRREALATWAVYVTTSDRDRDVAQIRVT